MQNYFEYIRGGVVNLQDQRASLLLSLTRHGPKSIKKANINITHLPQTYFFDWLVIAPKAAKTTSYHICLQ